MPIKALPTDLPIYSFPSCEEFENFLEDEHESSAGFYLKLAKKSSGIPSVSLADSIEIVLCFGWINGQGNGIDDDWFLSRYTPRRSKSIWSQKNVDTVERLTRAGKMRPAGLAAVEAAKADGRWERAYAGPATMQVPKDLNAALDASPAARRRFDTLNKTDRFTIMFRVETGSVNTRHKRVEAAVQKLAEEGGGEIASQSEAKTMAASGRPYRISKPKKAEHGSRRGQPRKSTIDRAETPVSRRAGLRNRP